MPCLIRRMCREDISQVTEIDREAFPTMWPPANYNRELEIGLAHYIVASKKDEAVQIPGIITAAEEIFPLYPESVQQRSNHPSPTARVETASGYRQHLVGFAGLWVMADEGHITNIAVREIYRRQGIGEQLLITLLKLATKQNTNNIILEVRVSNDKAQRLYIKYGFRGLGIRPKYYTDNSEDALVMGVDNISGTQFQGCLSRLEKAYTEKWGIPPGNIIR